MQYTYLELLSYLLIYSFLGWVVEVFVMSIRQKRFCNRGFFNLPLCLSYGIVMNILVIMLPTMREHYLFQFVTVLVTSSTIFFLSGSLAKRVSRKKLWQYEENNLFGGDKKKFWQTLVITGAFWLTAEVLHPIIFLIVHMLPHWLLWAVCVTAGIMLLLDLLGILYVIYRKKNVEELEKYRKERQEGKRVFHDNIYVWIWNRLEKAYPNIEQMDDKEADEKYDFAVGICFDKIIWIFLICALLGDIIETFYCRMVGGVWMSRSSVIYGPFSIVWGLGAAILTIVLQRLREKEDRYVFLAGFLLGGVYEYACSVFTEVFFGTVFWDYSHMPFNIGGRTNLLFCIFWGILAVVWVKLAYPYLSRLIEKTPPIAGKIATWIMLIFMFCNALISSAAMLRYLERQENKPAENMVEVFLDAQYDDDLIEFIWPNMKVR